MGGMALADLRTLLADLRTELAESLEPRRVSAHPAGTEHTDVTTVTAKARTLCHELVTMMLSHADHVIGAGLAGLRAGQTGINTVLLLLRQRVGLHDSISLDEVVDDEIALARTKPIVICSANRVSSASHLPDL